MLSPIGARCCSLIRLAKSPDAIIAAPGHPMHHLPEGPLFQIMKIVFEKQILGLCNIILPSAVDNHEFPDIIIDFKSLRQLAFPTDRFYGDKRTMGRILKEMGSIQKRMEE